MTLGRFEYQREFETFGSLDMSEVYKKAVALPVSNRNLGDIFKVLFDQLAKEKNIENAWLGDKTPLNIFNLGLVRSIFPRARFLHVIRDPADVIDSIVRMGQHGGAIEAALRWRNSIAAWRNFARGQPDNSRCEIKYEDLVRDVPGTLDPVARSFGLPAREHSISVANLLGDVDMRTHHSNVIEPVNPFGVGKGRARLSSEQRRVIGPVVNNLARSYGYDPI